VTLVGVVVKEKELDMNGKPKIHTVMTYVTVDMAKDWLAKNNGGNRRVRPSEVDMLANEIGLGGYEPTHQGIGFYEDGTLADGQHRLHAIVKAGVGIWINVTTGLKRVANHKIDKGLVRTSLDSLHFMGISSDSRRVAICTCMIYQFEAELNERVGWSPSKIPSESYAGYYQKFLPAIEFVLSFPSAGRYPAPVTAAVATAWFTEDRDRLAEFMIVLDTGETVTERDRACLRIRDYLQAKKYGQGTTARNELFLRCCAALRYFIEGKNLSKLYATAEHAFKFMDAAL
jgi:hypothetical protein